MNESRANFLILIATVFWGSSYILTKLGLEVLEPFNLTALRFVVAFIFSIIFLKKHIPKINFTMLIYSFFLSIILFFVFATMTIGLNDTTASNAGFIISLSVVLIPLISSIFFKEKISKKMILCSFSAFIGIGLLTLNSQLKMNKGDIFCLISAILFALHVIFTGIFTKKVDSVSLGVFQLGFVGIFSTVVSLITEKIKIPSDLNSWFIILFLSLFCTALGYILQAVAQQKTSPVIAGLILSLEPLISVIFAYSFLKETLHFRGILGAGILLLSVVLAELNITEINNFFIKSGKIKKYKEDVNE